MPTASMPPGVTVALVTPFRADGSVDDASFDTLVAALLADGVHGLALAGTTGESPTLRWPELERLLGRLQAQVRGRVPILVGVGTNDTAESVERAQRARALGADLALAVTPYYSRPAPAGVIEHYRRLGQVMPTVGYYIPYRTSLTLDVETLRTILALPGMVGMKESSGTLDNLRALPGLHTGDDALFLGALEAGAAGGILASANLLGRELVTVYQAARDGRPLAARAAFARLRPLIAALYAEPNPAPLKWALAHRGRIACATLRLPQVPISEALAARLRVLLAPPAPPVSTGPDREDEVARLVTRFAAQQIPAAEWTHQAHLVTGAWHVHHLGPDGALRALREGIARLNQSHGTPETPTRGYHETITRAYVELLAVFLADFPADVALGARVAALLAHPLSKRDALFTFYARDRLLSPAARASWLDPDRPLDPRDLLVAAPSG